MGFTAVNGFEMKISSGNALQCTSRDLYRLGKHFDLARLMSFFFSGSGFYITTALTIKSVFCFTLAQVALALCGAEFFEYNYELVTSDSSSSVLQDRRLSEGPRRIAPLSPNQLALSGDTLEGLMSVGGADVTEAATLVSATGSIYSAAYILQLGFATMLPYAMELWVETSAWRAVVGTLRMIAGFSFVFSLFTMQTKGFHFSSAISFGRAGYVATGRGFAMDTLSLIELYAKYAASHIHLGFEIMLHLGLFWLVTQQDASVYAISSIPVLLLVVALTLSPWIFNPGALTLAALSTAWREWQLWIDCESSVAAAGGHWRKWHGERMKSARSAGAATKCLLALQVALPRLILSLACTAYLRNSRVLSKFDPSWAVTAVCAGALQLTALALLHLLIQRVVDARALRRYLPVGARFLLTQANRAACVLAWVVLNWRLWEEWCWQFSCSTEEASRRECSFHLFGTTGAVAGFACVADPPLPRACLRSCSDPQVVGLDGISTSCVDAGAFTACMGAINGSASSCSESHAAPLVADYSFCMAQMPNLGIGFVASLSIVSLLVQVCGLVDSHGAAARLDEAEAAVAEMDSDEQQVIGAFAAQPQHARRLRADELIAQVGADVPPERLERALRSLSTGALRILERRVSRPSPPATATAATTTTGARASRGSVRQWQVHGGQAQSWNRHMASQGWAVAGSRRASEASCATATDAAAVSAAAPAVNFYVYMVKPLPFVRTRLRASCAALAAKPRRLVVALANAACIVADFYYRLLDVLVAIVLFAVLLILTLLPLHYAQSILLFNADYWQVLRRGMRQRDFLSRLWA